VLFDIFHNYGSELNYEQFRANKTILRIRGKFNTYQRVIKMTAYKDRILMKK